MKARSSFPRREHGVALITAVLMVALATILAVNVGFRGYLEQRRSMTLFALDQGYEVALGAEAWAADILRADKRDSKTDHGAEIWATPIPPLPIDGGELEGRLEDQQGRFNLNNLLRADGKANPQALAQFERILVALNLETRWAGMIVDWIDADANPNFPDGAEDGVYLGESPPFRTANMPITRVSELLSLPDFGLERYQKLLPYVTALPSGTPLNVCTAPGIVIDALSDGVQSFSTDLKHLADMRADKCFPNLNDLRAAIGQAAFDGMKESLSEQSSYFGATVWVTIGTTQFTLYSLLHRTDAGLVRPVLRSFGTD
ncbi:MAG: type II secretion system minor pseudopilin GspK [Steroidobacteraceae bacterium]